jgi:ElaB/YqjD/DUF883 family membrane-anchored ribosome-binding protein
MATTSTTSFPNAPGTSGSSETPPLPEAGPGPAPDRASSELLDRVVEGAHHAIDRLADSAAPHVQRLQQGVASASDTLHERAGQARELGDEWAESLRCTVRENPLAAVATALLVGVLIARLTQR